MATAASMLHDTRETYIRRAPADRWLSALRIGGIWLVALAASLALTWTSLKYGEVPSADPTTYFPYITQVAE